MGNRDEANSITSGDLCKRGKRPVRGGQTDTKLRRAQILGAERMPVGKRRPEAWWGSTSNLTEQVLVEIRGRLHGLL